jgi:hypothetical protein
MIASFPTKMLLIALLSPFTKEEKCSSVKSSSVGDKPEIKSRW